MKLRLLACLISTVPLLAQDLSAIQVEKYVTGLQFVEGPVWSHEGFLIFSDVPENTLWKVVPGEQKSEFRKDSHGAIGNTYDSQGRLYTCESRLRRVTRTDKKGKIEVLAERYGGKRLNAPNDIVVRKNGDIFFTDPAFGAQADSRELDFYGIYHLPPKGQLELLAKTAGRPNGIALSPDGHKLYVADTDERLIRVFDVDRNGKAGEPRVLISGIDGAPDGIKTDEKGNIWVAANEVSVYSAAGKQIGKIEVPEYPHNLAFGEPDFQSLFVASKSSIYRIRLDVKGSIQY